jgi:hypothetical protein
MRRRECYGHSNRNFGPGKSSVAEQQRREFMQTSAPRKEFVSGAGRHIRGVLDADFIESFVIRVEAGRVLAAAATAEDNFDLFRETRRIGHIICGNDATAKKTDVREHVEMFQCDAVRFHSTHG